MRRSKTPIRMPPKDIVRARKIRMYKAYLRQMAKKKHIIAHKRRLYLEG